MTRDFWVLSLIEDERYEGRRASYLQDQALLRRAVARSGRNTYSYDEEELNETRKNLQRRTGLKLTVTRVHIDPKRYTGWTKKGKTDGNDQ